MLGRRAEPGGDQHGAELVAVQGGGVRLVVRPRPPDMSGRGVLEEFYAVHYNRDRGWRPRWAAFLGQAWGRRRRNCSTRLR